MPLSRRVALSLLAMVLAFAASSCGRSHRIEWVSEANTYTLTRAGKLASSVDISDVSDTPAADAPALRQEYLISLRSHGEAAAALADHLTRDFPVDSASVPVRVERATVDGKPIWFVVEAWAEKNGTLTHRRMWLISRADFTVIGSSSYR